MSSVNGLILEGLHNVKVAEAVLSEVKSGLKSFFNKASVDSKSQKLCNDALNAMYLAFNSLGDNVFDKAESGFNKGEAINHGDAETGPLVDYYPSEYFFSFQVRFKKEILFKDMQSALKSELNKVNSKFAINFTMGDNTLDLDNDTAIIVEPFYKGVVKIMIVKYTNGDLT